MSEPAGKTLQQLEYAHANGIRYIILINGQWRIVFPLRVVS